MSLSRVLVTFFSLVAGLAAGIWWFALGGLPLHPSEYGTVKGPGRARVVLPAGEVRLNLRGAASAGLTVEMRRRVGAPLAVERVPGWPPASFIGDGFAPFAKVVVPRAGRHSVIVRGGATVTIGRAPWTPAGSPLLGAALAGLLVALLGPLGLRLLAFEIFPAGRKTVYERDRAKAAPDGWVTVDALVDDVASERTNTRIGDEGSKRISWVLRTTTRYVFVQPDGTLGSLVHEAELTEDVPRLGSRVTLAFDPSAPSRMVLLEDEAQHLARRVAEQRDVIQHGIEASAEVVAARPTGRVSRPDKPIYQPEGRGFVAPWARGRHTAPPPPPLDATELILSLRVSPPGDTEFEVTRAYWDDSGGVGPGTAGTYFFRNHAPEAGIPVLTAQARFAATTMAGAV